MKLRSYQRTVCAALFCSVAAMKLVHTWEIVNKSERKNVFSPFFLDKKRMFD